MENQIEIVKDIADGMIGIGGIPNNHEFYAEFDMRVRAALRIHDVVEWSEQLLDFIQWRKQVAVNDLTDKEVVDFYLARKVK